MIRKPVGLTAPYRADDDDDIQDYKKPWVGLTDKELPALAGDNGKVMDLEQTRKFYRVIERLLKEKNT
jgi:hypothetical protein